MKAHRALFGAFEPALPQPYWITVAPPHCLNCVISYRPLAKPRLIVECMWVARLLSTKYSAFILGLADHLAQYQIGGLVAAWLTYCARLSLCFTGRWRSSGGTGEAV